MSHLFQTVFIIGRVKALIRIVCLGKPIDCPLKPIINTIFNFNIITGFNVNCLI